MTLVEIVGVDPALRLLDDEGRRHGESHPHQLSEAISLATDRPVDDLAQFENFPMHVCAS